MTTYSFTTTSVLTFLILSTIFLLHFASASALGCEGGGYGCSDLQKAADEDMHLHRKMLMGLMGLTKASVVMDHDQEKVIGGEEYRRVPSGPDPLHHNGGGPQKRPRISP